MNFIIQDINHLKKISLADKITVITFSFIPVFLIIGTAVSELAIITLSIKFLLDFVFFKKLKIYNKFLFYFLFIIYGALIINLVFSVNFENSFFRNIFFIKYLIFTIGTIDFFSKRKLELFFIFKIWTLILFIFSCDLIVQFITQKNIIGMESPLKYHRLSGFMGDELKAGSLILFFCFIITGFLIKKKEYTIFGVILICFFLSTIFITGDRSNFFKSLIIFFCLTFFIEKNTISKLIGLFLIMTGIIISVVSTNNVFKERFKNKILDELNQNNYNIFSYVKNTEYGKIYSSAYDLYLQKKIFGVGNKNFRILCEQNFKKKYSFTENLKETKIKCNTHPHQIYLEILTEHGIFGMTIFLISLVLFAYKNFIFVLKEKDYLLTSLFFTTLIIFIPILPGGSFFTSFNANIFWLNLGFFYSYKNLCSQKKINH